MVNDNILKQRKQISFLNGRSELLLSEEQQKYQLNNETWPFQSSEINRREEKKKNTPNWKASIQTS